MNTIQVFKSKGSWQARHDDPKIKELFGTDVIPTAYLEAMPVETVLLELRRLNPGSRVLAVSINTQHTATCTRVFKNYDPGCPRCQELMEGAPARAGWQQDYYAKQQPAASQHDCKRSHCAPICTFGDW